MTAFVTVYVKVVVCLLCVVIQKAILHIVALLFFFSLLSFIVLICNDC